MTVSDNIIDAIKSFGESNLLNFGRSVADLLRESSSDADLCHYIEMNGYKVNFKNELVKYFSTGVFESKNPRISVPFIYTLLYMLDTKKFSPEDIVTQTFPKLDIDVGYSMFAGAIADALLKSIENITFDLNESDDTDSENDDSETQKAFDNFKAYVKFYCDEQTCENLTINADYLRSAFKTANEEYIEGLYNNLEAAVRAAKLDPKCLTAINELIIGE